MRTPTSRPSELTCEPAGTRPCGFVEERHDGPSGRARRRAEGEEKGKGGRRAPARGTKGGVAPAPRGRGGRQKRALGKGASGVSVEPEALERLPSRRREGPTPGRNRGLPSRLGFSLGHALIVLSEDGELSDES